MEIRGFASPLLSSNMYLIVEDGHAIVIDPFADVSPAEGLIIDKIILTHEHYDHISGVNLWKEKTGASVLCSEPCAANIQSPKKNMAGIFKVFCEMQTWMKLDRIPESDDNYSCTADRCFSDQMTFEWMGHHCHLFEVPGHSSGSIGILLDGMYFFSGDSLLEHSETEVRLPGGSRKLWEEIGEKRIKDIPAGVMVYPGHFGNFVLS